MAQKKAAKKNFAQQYKELENIVETVEKSADLNVHLSQFEKGLALAKELKQQLGDVEQTIETLKNKYSKE